MMNTLLDLHFNHFALKAILLVKLLAVAGSTLAFEGTFMSFRRWIGMRGRASELLVESDRRRKERTVARDEVLTEHYYICIYKAKLE